MMTPHMPASRWPGIKHANSRLDTSYHPFVFLRVPVNFQVWNTSSNLKYQFYFDEPLNQDSTLNAGDEITILLNVDGFFYNSCWKISLSDTTQYILPSIGDVIEINISKPFNSDDTYEFITTRSHINESITRNQLDDIYVVPDPYVVTASWEKPLYYSSGRGERRIDFVNLPQQCTINIFSMSGQHIKTIEHSGTIENGSESWDLVTEDGLTVSYGIYIFHVKVPKIGSKIGKFALIK